MSILKNISILIPVYNEEKRILGTLGKLTDYLRNKKFQCEIIIVDDGSKDRTMEIVKEFFDKSIEKLDFKILHFDKNRGKGFAIKNGMLSANGEYILFIDADCAAPMDEFDKFVDYFGSDYDVIIGSRKSRNELNIVEAPFYRKFFGNGYTKLASRFLGLKVTDVTCGFKCFKHNTLEPIFSKQLLYGWSFDSEILFLARKYGFKIKEIPVNWKHEEQGSKVTVFKEIFKSGWELIKIKINDIRGLYS